MKFEEIIEIIEEEYNITNSDYSENIKRLQIGESLEIYIVDFRSPISDEEYKELLIGDYWNEYYSPAYIVKKINENEYELKWAIQKRSMFTSMFVLPKHRSLKFDTFLLEPP